MPREPPGAPVELNWGKENPAYALKCKVAPACDFR